MNDNTTAKLLPYVKLMFEIDNPSLEECYQYGYQMAQDGADESENPFANHNANKENEYWLQGWWDSFYGIEPMFAIEPTDIAQLSNDSKLAELASLVAANDVGFEVIKESKITTVAKLAAVVAGAFLSYQVIDMVV